MRGHPVHIPEQNARPLGFLILNTGRLVTRQELQHFLWPEHAPYDTQQAINKAISQLRTALNDTSTKAGFRYIETIPRRGYRFCAEFRILPAPESPARSLDVPLWQAEPPTVNGGDGTAVSADQASAPSLALERKDAPFVTARRKHTGALLAVACTLGLAVTSVGLYARRHPT